MPFAKLLHMLTILVYSHFKYNFVLMKAYYPQVYILFEYIGGT